MPRFRLLAIGVAVLALAGACGDETVPPSAQAPAQETTAPPAAPRSYSGELTSSDGYRYRIVVAVGDTADCAPTPLPGRTSFPVTLTVTNQSADRPAPFPPVRIELTGGPTRERVMVRDPSGTCTFTPRVSVIPAGQSVSFAGATPLVAADAAPGAAGRIEVAISETTFSLVAPVP